ncbi:aspartate-semialdehyde dehydrogenase [Microgenomates group bacterium RBG_16_45_19]|nr:MAG: aspartate-semialdehyde dehydrogenase [Microgenomates group bacterium RBG_16_45_19]
MSKINVAVLGVCGRGGFAWIAQSILHELENHPFFQVTAVITERSSREGMKLCEGLDSWYEDHPLSSELAELSLLPPDAEVLRSNSNVGLVISALPPQMSQKLDLQLAAGGMPVLSESPGLRGELDIPLITPEINADHLQLIPAQQRQRGWSKGFIVANPGCTYTILALAIKPILDRVGIDGAVITTMQAISGAGPDAIAGMAIIDNIIPYIPQEETKLETELSKILGKFDGDKILPAEITWDATCCRVPVLDGHTAVVALECKKPISIEEAIEAWNSYSGLSQSKGLPHSPNPIIEVMMDDDRPQPRLDRMNGLGRSITIGRIRENKTIRNGITFIVVGHNRLRGTYGNTILNAELLYQSGLL